MILGFVLVLSIIGIASALSMYANLLPFIWTLGDIKQYNMAYYGAQWALERSLLVLRNQDAWFYGEWGRVANQNVWPVSDADPFFWQFMNTNNELYWKIAWRGSQVPISWLGNVELWFFSDDSDDFNTLRYNSFDAVNIGYDSTPSSLAYTNDVSYYSNTWVIVSAFFRLNPIVYDNFSANGVWLGDLCANGCDIDGDFVDNDIAIDRWRKWAYEDGLSSWNFSIFPFHNTTYSSLGIWQVENGDQAIRESHLSNISTELLRFWWPGSQFTPIVPDFSSNSFWRVVVSDNDNLNTPSAYFENMLLGTGPLRFPFQQLTLWLINVLESKAWPIYPFVEYRITCNGCGTGDNQPQLSQPYFYITAQSKVWDYDVKMQLVQSSNDQSFISSFTVVF